MPCWVTGTSTGLKPAAGTRARILPLFLLLLLLALPFLALLLFFFPLLFFCTLDPTNTRSP